jgi:hypothetical protein
MLKAMVLAERAESERLRQIIKELPQLQLAGQSPPADRRFD